MRRWSCRVSCREKIVQGRVDKIGKEMALLEQQFIKDTNKTVAVRERLYRYESRAG